MPRPVSPARSSWKRPGWIAWWIGVWFGAAVLGPLAAQQNGPSSRPRAREAGLRIGVLPVGRHNAITDVPGVRVGHETVIQGDDVRTGVTVVLPPGDNVFRNKLPAAIEVGNGFGKLVGVTQVQELGVLETPIALTNTLAVFRVADALARHVLELPGNEDVLSVNPVVGECNDGFLNDIRRPVVGAESLQAAIRAAADGPVPEGCVGAGVGLRCLGFKGGIGTSSRVLRHGAGTHRVGVLVQSNFGGVLNVAGAPVGQKLGKYFLKDASQAAANEKGSCLIVLATDAPLDARQLQRLARRGLLGLAAVGSPMTHGSGDYCIAFSTKPAGVQGASGGLLSDEELSPYFQAAKEAVEEAVVNSLFAATDLRGRAGRVVRALPLRETLEICRAHGVLAE